MLGQQWVNSTPPVRFLLDEFLASTTGISERLSVDPALTYVLLGIDVTIENPALPNTLTTFAEIVGVGRFFFDFDTTSNGGKYQSWRGVMPFYNEETLRITVESTLTADIGISAWGTISAVPRLFLS